MAKAYRESVAIYSPMQGINYLDASTLCQNRT